MKCLNFGNRTPRGTMLWPTHVPGSTASSPRSLPTGFLCFLPTLLHETFKPSLLLLWFFIKQHPWPILLVLIKEARVTTFKLHQFLKVQSLILVDLNLVSLDQVVQLLPEFFLQFLLLWNLVLLNFLQHLYPFLFAFEVNNETFQISKVIFKLHGLV